MFFVLYKQEQQVELFGRQGDWVASPAHSPGGGVNLNIRRQRQTPFRLSAAAQHRLHPGQQLRQGKGLGQIVLRSPAQAANPSSTSPSAVRKITGISRVLQ